MKKVFFLFALSLCLLSTLTAQDNTLFNHQGRSGFFVGLEAFQGRLAGADSYGATASVNFIVQDVYFGLYFSAAADRHLLFDDEPDYFSLMHGGLNLGINPLQRHMVHPYFDLKAGIGALGVSNILDWNPLDPPNNEYWEIYDNVFNLNFQFGLEINIASWLRMNGFYSYNKVFDTDSPNYSNADFGGGFWGIGIKVGGFGSYWCRNSYSSRWY